MPAPLDEIRARRLVEECLRREIGLKTPQPLPDQDLIETGVLDSMGWVSFLRALESASGVNDMGALLVERVPSLENILVALNDARVKAFRHNPDSTKSEAKPTQTPVFLLGSSSQAGSRLIPSEEVDRRFGMPVGKLRSRAGIEALAYVAEGEDELALASRAAERTLHAASCGAQELDWIICTSETHRGYPSLAARLHSQLLARETCGALDAGGACLGLLHALAVGHAIIGSGRAQTVLVVTSDVHSTVLAPGRVAGEFGGLFGDGASAFLLRSAPANLQTPAPARYALGEFSFGCAGQYAGAIRVADATGPNLEVNFDGEALSRAAITRMEKIIFDVEQRSGIARATVAGLATHQPNPRLVELLARQCGLREEKFPVVARKFGNLGSSTCGVALDLLLQSAARVEASARGPIFLVSLGPGLLFGGGWLTPA